MFHDLLSKTGTISPLFKDSSDKLWRQLNFLGVIDHGCLQCCLEARCAQVFLVIIMHARSAPSQTGSGIPVLPFSSLRYWERKKKRLEKKQLFATVLLACFSSETSTGWSAAQLLVVSDQLSVNSLFRTFLCKAYSSSGSNITSKAWTHLI